MGINSIKVFQINHMNSVKSQAAANPLAQPAASAGTNLLGGAPSTNPLANGNNNQDSPEFLKGFKAGVEAAAGAKNANAQKAVDPAAAGQEAGKTGEKDKKKAEKSKTEEDAAAATAPPAQAAEAPPAAGTAPAAGTPPTEGAAANDPLQKLMEFIKGFVAGLASVGQAGQAPGGQAAPGQPPALGGQQGGAFMLMPIPAGGNPFGNGFNATA